MARPLQFAAVLDTWQVETSTVFIYLNLLESEMKTFSHSSRFIFIFTSSIHHLAMKSSSSRKCDSREYCDCHVWIAMPCLARSQIPMFHLDQLLPTATLHDGCNHQVVIFVQNPQSAAKLCAQMCPRFFFWRLKIRDYNAEMCQEFSDGDAKWHSDLALTLGSVLLISVSKERPP